MILGLGLKLFTALQLPHTVAYFQVFPMALPHLWNHRSYGDSWLFGEVPRVPIVCRQVHLSASLVVGEFIIQAVTVLVVIWVTIPARC